MTSNIDYKEIIKIIDLLEERDLSEFELEVEGFKIKISRSQTLPERSESPSLPEPGQKTINQLSTVEQSPNKDKNNLHFITSPMVGTFYRAPDPSSPPFVEIGETIHKNQTLCIIEAMKLMNEIESDIDGVLDDVYVENGKPVEYGKKLFSIKPLE
jgi:acetyl-CoA carboxylase biotin carboxyl carrier protein